jgi:hypothetical protein
MIHCPRCGRTHPDSVITCDCGYDLQAYQLQHHRDARTYQLMSQPYRWLPAFQVLLRVMGVLCVIGGAVGVIVQVADRAAVWPIALTLVAAVIVAVPYFAAAEAIAVLLNLSEQQPDFQQTLRRIEQAVQRSNA